MRTEIRIMSELLEVIAAHFDNDVDRGSIFLPEGDYLTIKAYWGLSPESVQRTKCYIGEDVSKKRGSAGNVYLTRQQRVIHIQSKNGRWKSDDEYYIEFSPHRCVWPYRSSVMTPIFEMGTEEAAERHILGVMVFDSQQEAIFDSEEAKLYLRMASIRIASVLRIALSV